MARPPPVIYLMHLERYPSAFDSCALAQVVIWDRRRFVRGARISSPLQRSPALLSPVLDALVPVS